MGKEVEDLDDHGCRKIWDLVEWKSLDLLELPNQKN